MCSHTLRLRASHQWLLCAAQEHDLVTLTHDQAHEVGIGERFVFCNPLERTSALPAAVCTLASTPAAEAMHTTLALSPAAESTCSERAVSFRVAFCVHMMLLLW